MTLRKKTLVIVALMMLGLIVMLYVTSRIILLRSYVELEQQTTRGDVERVLAALSQELSVLDTTVCDWASWDDTYQFMEDANLEYVESNLLDDTLIALRLNLILLADSSGSVTFDKAFDLEQEEETPLPPSLSEHLVVGGILLTDEDTESGVMGIVLLPEAPMLVASRPILTSNDEGPMRGTMIMGRYLDSTEIDRLAETTRLSLAAHRFDDPQAPPDFQTVRSSFSEEAPVTVMALSAESIAGYAILQDIYGKPSLILRAVMPRGIYQQGQTTTYYFMVSLLVVGLVFGGVTLLVLERQVLNRVGRLGASVNSVRASGDLSARVSYTGEDELSSLGIEINRMLEGLEEAQVRQRKSEARYGAIVEDQTELICRFRPDGRLTFVNGAYCRYLGKDPEELLGREFVSLIVEEDRRRVETAIFALGQDNPVSTLEAPVVLPGGEMRWQHWANRAIFDDQGIIAEFQSVGRDITQRKKAEEALKEYSERLEEMVKERTEELRDAQEELVRKGKLATLGQLAGGVSHELRNPLAVISNAIYFLQMTLPDADEKTKEYLELISSEVRNSEKIVSDLLGFSRTTLADRSEVTVSELVATVLERQTPPDGVDVTTQIPTDLPPVFVDPQQIGQVLINLVTNAYEAMPDGGKLTIKAQGEKDLVAVSLTDTGCGMSEETMRGLFQPLFTTKAKGMGLGLAVVKNLLEANRGSIGVQSEEGKGSTFILRLPVKGTEE